MSSAKEIRKNWSQISPEGVLSFFVVDPTSGLSSEEIIKRYNNFGSNDNPTILEALEKFYKTTVIRDGRRQQIASSGLVLGDIVILEKDDIVPADLRLIEVDGLSTDQNEITGVSGPVYKNTLTVSISEEDPQRVKNIAYAGSVVLSGSAKGLVVAIGPATALAKAYGKTRPKKLSFMAKRRVKKIAKFDIYAQNCDILSYLKSVDTVIFNVDLSLEYIQEIIRVLSIDMGKNLIFVTDEDMFNKINGTVTGVVKIDKKAFADKSNKALLDNDHPILVLTNVSHAELLRYAKLLKLKDRNLFCVDKGQENLLYSEIICLVTADTAKQTSIKEADLIIESASDKQLFLQQLRNLF